MAAEVVVKSRVIAFGGLGRGCFLLLWGDGGGGPTTCYVSSFFSRLDQTFFLS